MKKLQKIMLAGILCVAGVVGCSQNDPATSHNETEEKANKTGIDDLFPKETDAGTYSDGMIKSTSVWKAGEDLPVFTRDEGGWNVTATDETIGKGDKFRILFPATFPMQDQNAEQIYGYMPDRQKYVRIADQDLRASLINKAMWDGNTGIELKQDTVLYDAVDGKKIQSSSRQQIFRNFDIGKNDIPWIQTKDGWFPLMDNNGSTFFSVNLCGGALGNFPRDTTMDHVYERILMLKQSDINKGTFSWGYAPAHLSDSPCPELLTISGAYEKDLNVEIYGDSSNVITSQSTGSFSMADSRLYQSKDNTLLRFQNKNGKKTITKISCQKGEMKTKELAQEEIEQLDPDDLKEIRFTSVYDPSALDPCEQYIAGDLYPDFDFEDHGYVHDQSKEEWILYYDMTVREQPDRNSKKVGSLKKGETVEITDIIQEEHESWGQLASGGWVCLEDPQYTYADPVIHAQDWKSAYKEIVENEAAKERYDGSSDYAPLWYLWTDSGTDVPILALKIGTCEADYQLRLYAYENGSVQYLGDTSAGHAGFYSTDMPGVFIRVMGHMGVESVDQITVTDYGLKEENLSSRQDVIDYYTPDGEAWEFQNAAAFK